MGWGLGGTWGAESPIEFRNDLYHLHLPTLRWSRLDSPTIAGHPPPAALYPGLAASGDGGFFVFGGADWANGFVGENGGGGSGREGRGRGEKGDWRKSPPSPTDEWEVWVGMGGVRTAHSTSLRGFAGVSVCRFVGMGVGLVAGRTAGGDSESARPAQAFATTCTTSALRRRRGPACRTAPQAVARQPGWRLAWRAWATGSS